FNVLMILGLSAAIVPLVVSAQLVRLDVPIMIGVSVLLLLLALDGLLSRWECGILAAGLVTYIVTQIVLSRRSTSDEPDSSVDIGKPLINVLLIFAGLGRLVLGARWLVQAAVQIAAARGATPLVIGLTIVAAGTSMPELATSVV